MKFQKGQSGNPKGAPKRDWTWSGELQKAVEKVRDGMTIKQAIAESLIKESMEGNVHATKALMDRMDGMPSQDITSGGEPLPTPIYNGKSTDV